MECISVCPPVKVRQKDGGTEIGEACGSQRKTKTKKYARSGTIKDHRRKVNREETIMMLIRMSKKDY